MRSSASGKLSRTSWMHVMSLWLLLFMAYRSTALLAVAPGRTDRDWVSHTVTSEVISFSASLKQNERLARTSALKRMASHNGDGDHSPTAASRLSTARAVAEEWIRDFSGALSEGRIADVLDLFVDDPKEEYIGPLPEGKLAKQFPPFWRDMVAFTWNIVTLEGKDSIRDMLEETMGDVTESSGITWTLAKQRPSARESFPPPLKINNNVDENDDDDDSPLLCEFWCDITTADGVGYAHVRLDVRTKRATTLLTTLLDLHDRPFQSDQRRSRGSIPGPVQGREYFSKQQSKERTEEKYHVAIVGAGQAGLSLAARLQAMDVPYILFEAGPSPGSSWRHARYPSLHLHDPVWYQHLPYMEFPKTWPIFTPKDKLADWLDAYATLMDLNIKTSTKVMKATRENQGTTGRDEIWKIETVSTGKSGSTKDEDGNGSTIRANHIVFATGNSSRPKIPKFQGASSVFRGIQLHTSQYTGGKAFAGKRVVVIGSNNSGFDICQDLWEQGAGSVTMIQRTGSMIVSSESVLKYGLSLFNEDPEYHHEDADLLLTTTPYRILVEGGGWKSVTNRMKENDRELIQNAEAAGYKFDYGYDGTGLFAKSATEGGGFYIDVGCAELLARKDVEVRYATVKRLESDAVVIVHQDDPGQTERLPADAVVYATGFDTMESYVEQICGREVVDRVGKTWGLGLNYKPEKDPGPWTGELRNMWKPTNVHGVWFHGGNLAQCRHYSKFLALQLAGRYRNKSGGNDSESSNAGEPKVYGIPPPALVKNRVSEREEQANVASSI